MKKPFSNILVLGANGQIGGALAAQLPAAFPAAKITVTENDTVDFEKPDTLVQCVRGLKPDLIINAAAYTAVDKAEDSQERDRVMQINAVAPGILAEQARAIDALLVHYSTDYVFDGCATQPYTETAPTAPLSVYGLSKRDGEVAIRQTEADAMVLRISWVYGLTGHNFLKTMRRLALERDELRVVNDQTGVPNESSALAAATVRLAGMGADALRERAGLYHLSAAGQTTWFGFAQAIFDALPATTRRPKLTPITTAEYSLPATRPVYGVLSSSLFQETFGFSLPAWQTLLRDCLAREE